MSASYCAPVIDALRSPQRRQSVCRSRHAARRAHASPGRTCRPAASMPSWRRRGTPSPRAALAAVFERRMLGQQQPFLLKRLRHLRLGVFERFADRHVAVAIAIGGLVVECRHEVLGEVGVVPLAAGLRRGHDHATRTGQRLQERAARAAGIDEHDALRREASTAVWRSPQRVRSGPMQIERGDRSVETAVADEQHEHFIIGFDACRRCLRTPSPVSSTPACASGLRRSERYVMLASGTPSFFLAASMNGLGPFLKFLRVFLVARDAGDHEHVRLLRRRQRCAGRPSRPATNNDEDTIASVCGPRCSALTRGPLSADTPTRPQRGRRAAMNSAGMSQSSRSSTTVTPRPL